VEWFLGAWTATTSHAAWDGRWPKATAKSNVFKEHLVVAFKRDLAGPWAQVATGKWREYEGNTAICW